MGSSDLDSSHIAAGIVQAELRMQSLNLPQRGLARRPKSHGIVAVQDQFEARGHRVQCQEHRRT